MAEQQAAKRRVAKFENVHAATKKASQMLRPNKLPLPLVPGLQTDISVKPSLAFTLLNNKEEMMLDKPDTKDVNEGVMPVNGADGPPTSKSEAGFGFELGNGDNSSTNNFGRQYSDEGKDDVATSGGGEQE